MHASTRQFEAYAQSLRRAYWARLLEYSAKTTQRAARGNPDPGVHNPDASRASPPRRRVRFSESEH